MPTPTNRPTGSGNVTQPTVTRPASQTIAPGARPDAVAAGDTVVNDTTQVDQAFKTTITATSKDSSFFDATGRIYELFGDAEVTYGDISLKAAYIRLNYATNEVFAQGRYDSTSKKWVGLPIFKDGAEQYDTKQIRYNFKSRKGIIQSVVTTQGEGNIRGPRVKKDADDNVYIGKGNGETPIYTTCNLAIPHFHIAATKIKVVHNRQIIAGPFYLAINQIPLPLGLPFGFFPIPKQREIGTSGLIFPQYGEEPNGRGFFLRDGGYYWAMNQYISMQFKGSIYGNGSWGAGVESQYLKRYRYGGNFALRFARNRTSNIVDTTQGPRNDFSIIWSHAPQNRGGRSSFSANVNVTSNSYNQLNAYSAQRYMSNVAGSSVQYSRQVGQYVRGGVNFRVNQNFGQTNPTTGLRENGQTDVSTDYNIGVTQIAPFALNGGSGRWYETFRVGMDLSGSALINNKRRIIDTTGLGFPVIVANSAAIRETGVAAYLDSLERVRQGDYTAISQTLLPFNFQTLPEILGNMSVQNRFSIPISLPNFKLARYINFTPGISFQGDLYTKQLNYRRREVPGTDQPTYVYQIDTLDKISATYSTSFNASVNTRAYGTYFIRMGRLEAIRHTIAPSVSFSYVPDLSSNFSQEITGYTDALGRPLRMSRYRGLGGSTGTAVGNAASISYSIVNQIEMKVRSRSDSSKSEFEKISLFDNISLTGSYNIYATQFNLSPINLSANTQILKKISFNFNATFDPYAYEYRRPATNVYYIDDRGAIAQRGDKGDLVLTRVNTLAINSNLKQSPLHLQNLNFYLSTRFAPPGADKPKQMPNANAAQTPAENAQMRDVQLNPDAYVDFNIPWSINVNYTFSLSRFTPTQSQIVQALQLTGDLSLTPKWKVSLTSGYDIVAKAPSLTQITVHRDLHCWDMNFSWTPFSGSRFRSNFFTFDIRARSSVLQDLKLTRRSRGGYNVGAY
ncbi:putative LPS assembly protein LptD [Tellurirhabdus bombi]|uniref:putative LPS assembly protein LptD n=1 Tax=Tellurirhabdus bombi TaxID=2907205 RepID=UPI001F26D044|nr:putative LPS assembly protein LptD [Tellurirhabdus bombi]